MLLSGILDLKFYSPKDKGPRLKAFPHIHITPRSLSAASLAFHGSNVAEGEARLTVPISLMLQATAYQLKILSGLS